MKKIISAISAIVLFAGCAQKPAGEVTDAQILTSPSGNMEMTFHLTAEGTPQYTLNYGDQKVTKIKHNRRGYELKLSNGLEVEFDNMGNFLRLDD